MCLYDWCVKWMRRILVYVCLMYLVKAWGICMCKFNVCIEGVGYMCVCLFCEMKGWNICVCMSDMWSEMKLLYICLYFGCLKWKRAMYVCVRVMCDVKAWNICLCRWDVRNEGVCYMCVHFLSVNWRCVIYMCAYRREIYLSGFVLYVSDLCCVGVGYVFLNVWCVTWRREM